MNVKSTAIAIALFAMAYSNIQAVTIEGVTTNRSTFTASLIIITNKTPVVSGSNFTYKVGQAKVTNKQLLSLFSAWTTNTWPKGARLIFDWETYQVCVA